MANIAKERLNAIIHGGYFKDIADALTEITRHYLPRHHWVVQPTADEWEVRLVGRDAQNKDARLLNVAQARTLHAAFSGAGLRTGLHPDSPSKINFLIQISTVAGSGAARKFDACVTNIGDNAQVMADLQQLEQIRPGIETTLLSLTKPPQFVIDKKALAVLDITTGSSVLAVRTETTTYAIDSDACNKDKKTRLVVTAIVSEKNTEERTLTLRFVGKIFGCPDVAAGTLWRTGPITAINFANGLTWSPQTGWRRTEDTAATHKTPAAKTQSPHTGARLATSRPAQPSLAF